MAIVGEISDVLVVTVPGKEGGHIYT